VRRTGEGNSVAAKVAIVILADTETRADRAKVANALTTAYEFKETGEEVTVVFTGAGTSWIPELSDPDHRLHKAFDLVKD
jgi:predicted peroxiredoxin